MSQRSKQFTEMVNSQNVIVCVGSGGVGKTTTSAVIGLHAAIMGRKVLVLTIDPARRLANSLGIEVIGNTPSSIPLERFQEIGIEPKGSMDAMMLDMKVSFDHLVEQHAPDEDAKRRILNNKLYQYFSTSLAGTQEYAAAEKLYELHQRGEYDLIVLDTPPTSHALDFLEAPNRLVEALNSRAMQFLYKPGRPSLLGVGTGYVIKTLSKFTGSELIDELGAFLKAFSTLFAGFQDRARKVRELLTSSVSTFCVVTAPNAGNIDEALYFYEKLGGDHTRVGAFITNRVHPAWVPREELKRPSIQIASELEAHVGSAPLHPITDARAMARRLRANASDFQVLADLDRESIAKLGDKLPDTLPILRVPYFSHDIHSLKGLNHVRHALFEIDAP